MSKRGKKFRQASEKIEPRPYELGEAVALAKEVAFGSFDETFELAVRLGVDPRHADQMVRGTVALPHGTGKQLRVLVFATGEKMKEAEEAGADYVGGEELAQKISDGWLEFDAVVATPDMMKIAGRLGRILGPRGMMPNPKTGTVTFDVGEAVRQIKAGRIEFRVDKAGIIHAPFGRASFPPDALRENAEELLRAILRARPAAAKGRYLMSVSLSTTLGPGIRLDPAAIGAEA